MLKALTQSNTLKALLIAGAASFGLTACQGDKEGIGTLLGAVAGAAIGNEIGGEGTGEVIAIAGGTLAGAAIGGSIGRSLDRADRVAMHNATYRSLEHNQTGSASEWVNPDTGHRGTVTPVDTYQTETGQYCREFQQTIIIGGEEHEGYGTACRQPDGTWKIVETDSQY